MRRSLPQKRPVIDVPTLFSKIGLFVFLISGTLYITEPFSFLQMPFLTGGVVLLFIGALIRGLRLYNINFLGWLYLLFSISILFSFFAHFETSMLLTFGGLILIYFSCKFTSDNFLQLNDCREFKKTVDLFILFQLLLLIAGTIYNKPSFNYIYEGYQGIFSNPNGLGGFSALLISLSYGSFLSNLFYPKKKRSLLLFYFVSIVAGLCFIFLSKSRTALVTVIISFLAGFICIILTRKLSSKQIFRGIFLSSLFVILILVILKIPALKTVVDNMLNKFQVNRANGNTLSDRDVIWNFIFDRVKFFGNGEETAVAAHSTYLSMLDQYGILSFVFLCIFMLFGVLSSFMYLKKKQNARVRFIPFMIFLNFASESLMEMMMLKSVMLFAVLCTMIISKKSYGKSDS